LVTTGKEKTQAAVGVEHLAMSTPWEERLNALADIIKVYAKGGKTMVFTETKNEANEVALSSSISSICQVLHGDIAQKQREVTLSSFREGLFQVLVATDVAARGLDIEGVDLIIQSSPPKDYEQYIHRSGRTGRAGKYGISITLYPPRKWGTLKNVERQGKFTFTRVGIPQPKDLYEASGAAAVKDVCGVDLDVIPHFLPFAREIIEYYEGNAEQGVASALALIAGCTKKAEARSLLANTPGHVTVLLTHKFPPFRSNLYVQKILLGELSPEDSEKMMVRTIKMTKDGAAVADVPESFVQKILESNKRRGESRHVTISVISELPPLIEENNRGNNNFRSHKTNGFGRGGGFSSFGGRRGGSTRGGRGQRRKEY